MSREITRELRDAIAREVASLGSVEARLALPNIAHRHGLTLEQVKGIAAEAPPAAARSLASGPGADVRALIEAGRRHPASRINRLAERAAAALDQLVQVLRADAAARRAGGTGADPSRLPAKPTPCGVDGCDRTFEKAQGAALHRYRVHGIGG